MKTPVWLQELHRQWFAARGKSLGARSRPFSRDWPKLLEDAGIRSAEDEATAAREGERLEQEGRLVLKRHRFRRYYIERVELPLASETWLHSLFQTIAPDSLRRESLGRIEQAAGWIHPLYPRLWDDWLRDIRKCMEQGRDSRPLSWRHPEVVAYLLNVTFRLTSRTWDLLIREVSTEIGLDSKELERRARQVERCLSAMFQRPMTLGLLGIVAGQLHVEMAGNLCLHFPDGEMQVIDSLDGIYHLTSDLGRAVRATTAAKRLLTVENRKTTLRRLSVLNRDADTLLLSCAYPEPGLVRLLELVSNDLPLFHFGDTDPAGYLILSKLRQVANRPVIPFLMQRRDEGKEAALGSYDRRLLPGLLADPRLVDCRPDLEAIAASGDKRGYEQESLGVPDLPGWPFYRRYRETS